MGWHTTERMGWDGMGWDGMGWDGMAHQRTDIPTNLRTERRCSLLYTGTSPSCCDYESMQGLAFAFTFSWAGMWALCYAVYSMVQGRKSSKVAPAAAAMLPIPITFSPSSSAIFFSDRESVIIT